MINKNTKAIISLTSHKTRIKHCSKSIFSAIRNCCDYVHTVLTISKENKKFIDGDIKKLIDTGIVELLLVDEDLGPHTKYFYVMKKYRNYPIITIDDDQRYFSDTIPNLIKTYEKTKNVIIGRQVRIIQYNNNKILPFSVWAKNRYEKREGVFKTNHLMGVGGILYPPNILDISDELLPEIRKYRKADDIFLNALEFRKNIKLYCLPDWKNNKPTEWDEFEHKNSDMTNIALREEKTRWTDSDFYVNELQNDFNKGLNE